MKTKAAILVEQNQPLVIDEIVLPDTLEYGQVLVKVISSGICGSQLGEIDGIKGPDKFLPHLLGHEGGGIVEKIGPGVSKVKKGDHVVMHWRKGEGIESLTPKYQWNDRQVNAGWITTFNEFAIVSENRLTPISSNIDFEIAALLGCAVPTGFGIINNNAKLKIGESVVIFGIGSVGMNVVQGASLVSAYPIIAVDLYTYKLELAKKFGATHVINANYQDVTAEIFSICGSLGVDVAIDNTGSPSVIEMAYEVTSPSGRTILVGVPPHKKKISLYTLPLHFEKKLLGSHGGDGYPSTDIPNYIKLIESSKIQLNEMITHRFTLDNINVAMEQIRNGMIGKCLIQMS